MQRNKKGLLAEYVAMLILALKGYEILQHRFGHGQKGSNGEIDLIAKKKNTICFIEIKFRKNMSDSLHSVSENQKQRIRNNANLYIKQNPKYQKSNYRFDCIAFSKTTLPKHIKNAF